jgi:hypothetical protein
MKNRPLFAVSSCPLTVVMLTQNQTPLRSILSTFNTYTPSSRGPHCGTFGDGQLLPFCAILDLGLFWNVTSHRTSANQFTLLFLIVVATAGLTAVAGSLSLACDSWYGQLLPDPFRWRAILGTDSCCQIPFVGVRFLVTDNCGQIPLLVCDSW